MKNRKQTNCVIFHHSLSVSGNVDIIRQWHKTRGFEDIGYHYVVIPTGEIQKGRDVRLVGAHSRDDGRNGDSIGVCLVGDMRRSGPTEDQIQACSGLYHRLCRAYSKTLAIEFHRPVWMDNACPGKCLDRWYFTQKLMENDPYGDNEES